MKGLKIDGEWERLNRLKKQLKQLETIGTVTPYNKEISQIGDLTRNQVYKLMTGLRDEGHVECKGHSKSALWRLISK